MEGILFMISGVVGMAIPVGTVLVVLATILREVPEHAKDRAEQEVS
mgnify:CR=1 FL=1